MSADYFAELYVAGRFADAAWNVYFFGEPGLRLINEKDWKNSAVIEVKE